MSEWFVNDVNRLLESSKISNSKAINLYLFRVVKSIFVP